MIIKLAIKTKKIIKRLIRPLYYSDIAYNVFNFIERQTGYKIERRRIYKEIGYYPDLKNPRSFNEKILWKKIYDRNPLLPIVADKFRVSEYLKEVLGQKEAKKILVPLFYVTDKPKTIPFDSLTSECVIKPNNLSKKIILAEYIDKQKRYTIVDGRNTSVFFDSNQARNEIIDICRNWLSRKHGFYKHEWAARSIKPKILIEKLLRDSGGEFPVDYKFHIFHGECHLIGVIYDRFIGIKKARYTPEWEYLDVKGRIKQAGYHKKPENLKSMIDLAELLGKPFDFIRVDLYLLNNQIYFSELTSYPVSGTIHFNPMSFDFELGSRWKVVPKYWK